MERLFAILLRSPYIPNPSSNLSLNLTTIKELDNFTWGGLLSGGRVQENEVFQYSKTPDYYSLTCQIEADDFLKYLLIACDEVVIKKEESYIEEDIKGIEKIVQTKNGEVKIVYTYLNCRVINAESKYNGGFKKKYITEAII